MQLDVESAESNRMLGLSLQGQGQLDMAFEKFRKLPPNDASMELLYNLALDFERKRQFNKASSVYAFMKDHAPKFRDIKQRMNRAQAMEETVIAKLAEVRRDLRRLRQFHWRAVGVSEFPPKGVDID